MLSYLQRKVIFPRYFASTDPGVLQRVSGVEVWWKEISAGKVEAWFLPGKGVSAVEPGPLVVFAHGNAETIDLWPEDLQTYRDWGLSVLLPEYRGYGRSAGSPSEAAIKDDMEHFLSTATQQPRVDPSRVVYHGRSLGGGAVCALGTIRPPRALILESTFTSVADFARKQLYVPRALISDPFDNLAFVKDFDGPSLIIHGDRDEVLPYQNGVDLHQAARDSRFETFHGCGHNDLPHGERFWDLVRAFFLETGILP